MKTTSLRDHRPTVVAATSGLSCWRDEERTTRRWTISGGKRSTDASVGADSPPLVPTWSPPAAGQADWFPSQTAAAGAAASAPAVAGRKEASWKDEDGARRRTSSGGGRSPDGAVLLKSTIPRQDGTAAGGGGPDVDGRREAAAMIAREPAAPGTDPAAAAA